MNFSFKNALPHLIAIVVMALFSIIYFFPEMEGKTLPQGDMTAYRGMSQEANAHYKKTGEHVKWTNSMFGGMPTYQLSLPQKNNYVKYVVKSLRLNFGGATGMIILAMISFYISMLLLGVNAWISLMFALLFGFTTSSLILYEAGHITKTQTIAVSPPIIAATILALRGRYLLGGFFFTLFMALNMYSNHPQMTYYLGITMVFLVPILAYDAFKKGELPTFFKGSAVLLLGLLLAIGTFASKAMTTYEYSKDTMRGEPILTKSTSEASSSSNVDGLDWQYAMNWSNGWVDLLSSWVPRGAGGGTVDVMSKDSKFAKLTGQKRNVQGYPYFGGLPSTVGPYYFGAVVFFLFILGLFVVERRYKWWFLVGVIFTLLLSLGKNFEIMNRFLFDYIPLFNKFRTPNSVLSIPAVMIPILAAIGLHKVVKNTDKDYTKSVVYSLGIAAGMTVLGWLMVNMSIDFSSPVDARLLQSQGGDKMVAALKSDRSSMFNASILRSLFFILASGALVYFFVKKKLTMPILVAGIGILALLDVIPVDQRYLSSGDFVTQKKYSSNFDARPVDKQILTDTDIHYRVHDITTDPFNSAKASYHHKTIGGYHAAKLQRIQDMIDRYISKGEQKVFDMLNTKYFIASNQGKEVAQRNPNALGNAWFVNDIKVVNTPNEEIDAIAKIDPKSTAVIHQEFSEKIGSHNAQSGGNIKLTSYSPDVLEYTYTNSADQMAVFSEVWYGPNKGWKLYVDDKEVPLVRANYLLRAAVLPAGSHSMKMVFDPQSYATGETISLVCNILLILLGLYTAYVYLLKRKEEDTAVDFV